MNLPAFKYHRDPIQSGSIVESNSICECCARSLGYIYCGPVYSEQDLDERICPWCIADGSAHLKFDATFVDEAVLPDDIPATVIEELCRRTPGYNAWQSERWFSCCQDAVTFIAPLGIVELRERYRELEFNILGNILYDLQISGGAAKRMLESLDRDSGPTAYLFQCSKCSAYRTFVDGIFDVH